MNRVGWKWVLFCAVGGIVWVALLTMLEASLSGEHIWIKGQSFDAGLISSGESITHRVWLFNPTGRALDIRFEPTCGCTVSESRDKMLTPFNGIPVTIQVDTRGKSAGRHQEVIDLVIRSGDASWREQIVIRYRVSASLKKEVLE